jgi:membrane associated rhomboid family serine protease
MLPSFRSSPATWLLSLSWVAVFVALAIAQGSLQAGSDWLAGGVRTTTTAPFGHLTAALAVDGQPWRVLTSTFLHFSLLHLAMNLLGLLLLGPIVEAWYGGWTLVTLYALTGGLGNAVAVAGKRLALAYFPNWSMAVDHPSGGGSTVICGLVAFLAVVGWRMNTRFGAYLKQQMVMILALTAVMGLLVRNIDNFGHAGGTIVGAALGAVAPWLDRLAARGKARGVGVIALLLLAASGVAQYRADRTIDARALDPATFAEYRKKLEDEVQRRGTVLMHLLRLRTLVLARSQASTTDLPGYDPIGRRLLGPMPYQVPGLIRDDLAAIRGLDTPARDAPSFARLAELAEIAARRRPLPGEVTRFEEDLRGTLAALGVRTGPAANPAAKVGPGPSAPAR